MNAKTTSIACIVSFIIGASLAGISVYLYSKDGLERLESVISEIEANKLEFQQRTRAYETSIVEYERITAELRATVIRQRKVISNLEGSLDRMAELTQTTGTVHREVEAIFERYKDK